MLKLGMYRYRGRCVRYPDNALLGEVRRVARLVHGHYTLQKFRKHSPIAGNTLQRRFGSWHETLARAGLIKALRPMAMGRKYTWEECYANMHRLWLHYRRAPTQDEADAPPSRVGGGTYHYRFGTWRNALAAYVAYRNGDKAAWPMTGGKRGPKQGGMAHGRAFRAAAEVKREKAQGRVTIGLQLRYKVMLRDHFRCTLCGANPAADPSVVLHVDHVAPQAAGGKTSIENLRTLCVPCNVGKGSLREEVDAGGAEPGVLSGVAPSVG